MILSPHPGGKDEARFRQEAHAASRLGHPNVITLFDFGITSTGEHYLAMELLRGRTLRRRSPSSRSAGTQVRLAAHELNLGHLDLARERLARRSGHSNAGIGLSAAHSRIAKAEGGTGDGAVTLKATEMDDAVREAIRLLRYEIERSEAEPL